MPTAEERPRSHEVRTLLAQNVVRLRRKRGLSQEALALDAGLHRTFIAHVERGARNLSIDNIEKIANSLGVQAFELLLPHPNQNSKDGGLDINN
jgi:transcriptional regulator with XRE-family HTH domain